MGKLTDSLKAATKQLDDIKHGIGQMTELGQELVDNTLVVADTALRAGYAYAKAEAEAVLHQEEPTSLPQAALPPVPTVLDADHLVGESVWTEKSLKKRFKTFQLAYDYIKNTHHSQPEKRSWKSVVDTFNGASNGASIHQPLDQSPNPSLDSSLHQSLEQRVVQLEQIVTSQEQRIVDLETRLDEITQHLQQALTIVASNRV
jgi:hypothetical protein